MNQPQLTQVWEYLDAVDRPDVYIVDASHEIEQAFVQTWLHSSGKLSLGKDPLNPHRPS